MKLFTARLAMAAAVAFIAFVSEITAANATVLVSYNLTFTGTNANGTGVLKLNLPSFPDNNVINFTSLPNSIFSSLTATIGAYPTFNLTNANIAFGGVQGTNSSSIDVSMTQSTTGFAVGTPYLSIFNGAPNAGTFQILPFNQGGGVNGSYIIGAPSVAAVPEPVTLSLFGAGLAGTFVMRRRKKAQQA